MKKVMELYLHIPFCVRKCLYCDFLSFSAENQIKEDYVEKLTEEIKAQGTLYQDYEVISVFIGGGTPSILLSEQIRRIMNTLKTAFSLAEQAEITIEANPGTLNFEKLKVFRDCGINRLSLGLQSAKDEELKALGRIHNLEEFLTNFRAARVAGFSNINVDLMSALPGQTMESYQETIRLVTELMPEHISAYSLIIEEGTPFCDRFDTLDLPDEDTEREMYHFTKKYLQNKGYGRYEISNYAKTGRECNHNIGYWTGVEYLGIGLGSSSFIEGSRFSNEGDLNTYLNYNYEDFLRKSHQKQRELLTKQAQMEEFMFLGLRLTAGISASEFENRFKTTLGVVYGDVLERFLVEGLMEKYISENENRKEAEIFFKLTEFGTDVSNHVLSRFLL